MTNLTRTDIKLFVHHDDYGNFRQATIEAGPPDDNGHVSTVAITAEPLGFSIQANFSDFREQRRTYIESYGTALTMLLHELEPDMGPPSEGAIE
jgi:hypothetical protein